MTMKIFMKLCLIHLNLGSNGTPYTRTNCSSRMIYGSAVTQVCADRRGAQWVRISYSQMYFKRKHVLINRYRSFKIWTHIDRRLSLINHINSFTSFWKRGKSSELKNAIVHGKIVETCRKNGIIEKCVKICTCGERYKIKCSSFRWKSLDFRIEFITSQQKYLNPSPTDNPFRRPLLSWISAWQKQRLFRMMSIREFICQGKRNFEMYTTRHWTVILL